MYYKNTQGELVKKYLIEFKHFLYYFKVSRSSSASKDNTGKRNGSDGVENGGRIG